MDNQVEIPQRSGYWFNNHKTETFRGKLFDKTTIFFTFFLIIFSFIVLWPVVSRVYFEEAYFLPLIPLILNTFSSFGIGNLEAARIIFMISFILSTVGIYLFLKEFIKRQIVSILAGILYILPPVSVFVLAYFVRGLSAFDLLSARSFFTVMYGNGSLLAVGLIPFASIFFLRFLKRGENIHFLMTILFVIAVLLSSQTQALSLLLIFAVILINELFFGLARLKIKRFLMVIFFCAGLVSFWYLPIIINKPMFLIESQTFSSIKYLFPLPFIIGVLGLIFSFVFFGRKENRQGIFVAFLSFMVFLSLTVSWLFFHKVYVYHPNRLVANLFMFGVMVISLAAASVFDSLHIGEKIGFARWKLTQKIIGLMLFALVLFFSLALILFNLVPLAISLVSGPEGIWTKIRMDVMADRQESLQFVGGNFRLYERHINQTGIMLGWIVTFIFIITIAVLSFRGLINSKTEE